MLAALAFASKSTVEDNLAALVGTKEVGQTGRELSVQNTQDYRLIINSKYLLKQINVKDNKALDIDIK